MIFAPNHIVWYLSQFMTLEPGDLILTGTPKGVGLSTGKYLRPGDVVELEIPGLGRQRQDPQVRLRQQLQQLDLLPSTYVLKGCRLIDGSGSRERPADVVIDEGRLRIFPAGSVSDRHVIDLDGLAVTRGSSTVTVMPISRPSHFRTILRFTRRVCCRVLRRRLLAIVGSAHFRCLWSHLSTASGYSA